MRQTLADWKKIIIRKKYTRVLLEKTRSRWTKQHLTRLFRRWNDYAVAEKVRKSNEQIQLYRDSKHDFQELIGRLQVQVEGAKLHTPFDILEATNAPPEMTNAPQLLAKANIALQNAVNTVQYACSKRSSAMRRTRAGPFELVDRRVWRNKYMLTTLPVSKLVQLLLNESDNKQSSEELTEELKLIEEVLGEHYDRLRQSVFEKVSSDVAASMETATLMLPLTHTLSAPVKDPGSVKGREMTPAEFLEALVHIVRSDRVQWKGGSATTLAIRFRGFLEEIVFLHAMRPDEEKSNVFRPQLLTFECREVFTTHHKKLRSMYSHFVASEVKSERRFANQDSARLRGSSKMLSANGFVNCCQHFDLFRDNLLHFDDIQHILAETLQLERESVHFDLAGVATDSEAGASEPEHKAKLDHPEENVLLTLTEFLEALAAVACYLNPDAFVSLAPKLDVFFSERLESSAITS
ncbi:hypothetical protein GQ600_18134 [Phytophthora cactorum]|nr:hypothetical protein GQ600_18134 [Phytophthora cactorum]